MGSCPDLRPYERVLHPFSRGFLRVPILSVQGLCKASHHFLRIGGLILFVQGLLRGSYPFCLKPYLGVPTFLRKAFFSIGFPLVSSFRPTCRAFAELGNMRRFGDTRSTDSYPFLRPSLGVTILL